MRFDIFDINHDMPTGPDSPSLPLEFLCDGGLVPMLVVLSLHNNFHFGVKVNQGHPSIVL